MLKHDATNATPPPGGSAAACSNCFAEERKLLHHVRDRGVFRRLCTTCVLRLYPQSFCPTCFTVYSPSPPPNDAVLTCSKCYSCSHSRCVPSPPTPYVCPLCVNPDSPIFRLKTAREANVHGVGENMKVMDYDAARVLLAAAKIGSMSMNKAVVVARLEAERKAKEAAYARKRARDALEHVAFLVSTEKKMKKEEVRKVVATDVTPDRSLVRTGFGIVGSHLASAGGQQVMGAGTNGGNRNVNPGNVEAPMRAVGEPVNNKANVGSNGSRIVNVGSDMTSIGVQEGPGNNMTNEGSNGNKDVNVDSGTSSIPEGLVNNVTNVGGVNSSAEVLAAMNAVELRENNKESGNGVWPGSDYMPMDVTMDEKQGAMVPYESNAEASGFKKDNGSATENEGIVNLEVPNMQGETGQEAINGVASVPSGLEETRSDENRNVEEQQNNVGKQ